MNRRFTKPWSSVQDMYSRQLMTFLLNFLKHVIRFGFRNQHTAQHARTALKAALDSSCCSGTLFRFFWQFKVYSICFKTCEFPERYWISCSTLFMSSCCSWVLAVQEALLVLLSGLGSQQFLLCFKLVPIERPLVTVQRLLKEILESFAGSIPTWHVREAEVLARKAYFFL